MRRVLFALPLLAFGACLSLGEVERDEQPAGTEQDSSTAIDGFVSDGYLTCEPGKKVCDEQCVPFDDPGYGCAPAGCSPCALTGATALCQNLGCVFDACLPGHEDCDANPANGCEVDLATDLANCGACGAVCGSTHATAACISGVCELQCAAGHGNCNGQTADGCETVLGSVSNCGACGVTCLQGFVCQNGTCRCNADADCTSGFANPLYGICTPDGVCDCDNGWLCKAGKKCSYAGC
jgi:hypothetical protein